MTLDDMISVLQAAKAGKTIQWRTKTSDNSERWQDCLDTNDSQHFSFGIEEYRIKPEKQKIWMVRDKDGRCLGVYMEYAVAVLARDYKTQHEIVTFEECSSAS